jgi:hypothetical protein
MIKKLGGIRPLVLAMCLLTSLAALASALIPVSYRSGTPAIGDLRRLKAAVLAAAGPLKPVIMEALLARSVLRTGGAA